MAYVLITRRMYRRTRKAVRRLLRRTRLWPRGEWTARLASDRPKEPGPARHRVRSHTPRFRTGYERPAIRTHHEHPRVLR
jgi:hypothetical protein